MVLRIAHMSDLHLEFEPLPRRSQAWRDFCVQRSATAGHPDRGPLLNQLGTVDLVVLAGDIDVGVGGIAYADQVATFTGAPVIYVAGNHEAYDRDLKDLPRQLQAAAWATEGRVFFLEQKIASLWFRDQRLHILGCTLWTDYAIDGQPDASMREAARRMRDHACINWEAGCFLPAHALDLHRASLAWLDAQMANLRSRDPLARILIVSHHAPCRTGLKAGRFAPAYASDLESRIRAWHPQGWIHGHTHQGHLTLIDDVPVTSAPRGYLGHDHRVLTYRPAVLELSC